MDKPARGNSYMFFVIIYQFLLSFVFSLYYRYGTHSAFIDGPYFSLISQWLASLPPFVCYLLLTRQKTPDALPLKRLSIVNLGLIIGMCVAVQPMMMLLSALSSLVFPNHMSELMESMQTSMLPFMLLTFAVSPAICEEITFRGVVLTNYKNVDIKKAALINGLFFGIMHFDLQQFLYAFMMGVVFAYFVHYSQSLYASIVAHLSVNGIQILQSHWLQSLPEPTAEELQAAEAGGVLAEFVLIIVLVAIFLPVFIILFRSFVSLNKRRMTDGQIFQEVFLRLSEETEEVDTEWLKEATDAKKAGERIVTPAFWGVVCVFAVFTVMSILTLYI